MERVVNKYQPGDLAGVQTLSILFTDLVASTELAVRVGPDRADVIRARHFATLRDAIAAAGGREVKTLGDGLMVTFRSVAAAMQCAVWMQQAVQAENAAAACVLSHPELLLRIGIGVGEVVCEGSDLFGLPVVEASRLCDQAAGGEIVVSDLARILVGRRGGHIFVRRGALELKGFGEPVRACAVCWDQLSAAGRSAAPISVAA
jgi:class 3 adenylate cyclase